MGRTVCAVVLVLTLGLLPGCVDRFIDFHVHRLVGLQVERIDGQGFTARVRCELENPNALGAEVLQIQYRASIGSHPIGEGRLDRVIPVRSRSRFILELPLRVAYRDLPADFPARVKDGFLKLRTEANLEVKTSLGTYRMHLVSSGRTEVARALEVGVKGPFQAEAVRVESIALDGVELRRIRLRLRLTAKNLFPFPVRIRRGTFALAINGSSFGRSALEQELRLPPGARVPFEMRVAATHSAVGNAIASMMGSEPTFQLQGTLWIDPIAGVSRVPIDVQADSSVFSSDSR